MLTYDFYFRQFEIFILIFMRIASFCYVAPFFNTANTPRRIKVMFAFCLTVLTVTVVPDSTYVYDNIIGYTALVVKEVVVGILLGMVGNWTIQIVHFSGRFIDMDIGLSMASVMDPTNRTQVGIVGSIYYYVIMMLLITSGMHWYIVSAIVDSFKLIPVGSMMPNSSLYHTIVGFIGTYCVIGFRIALPIFASMLILNCVLAIMSKVAPHMNMFVMGMQLKIIGGLLVLILIVFMMPSVSNYIYDEIKYMMSRVVEGLT